MHVWEFRMLSAIPYIYIYIYIYMYMFHLSKIWALFIYMCLDILSYPYILWIYHGIYWGILQFITLKSLWYLDSSIVKQKNRNMRSIFVVAILAAFAACYFRSSYDDYQPFRYKEYGDAKKNTVVIIPGMVRLPQDFHNFNCAQG